ncbi:hypothetical protein P152DRAFT_303156 [Eremomyces bilateralis CBS 781.70]|uniref:Uncharacterized protein n=1 Tax=Eremomyces bilateralis CBS 781.70 TaxID=1392243 RepID=A0A6G1G7L0_9PEZI|nr:uncharacterized protein P152DRAFT_303156 [Eremomyces bilateralis CBS 781.70]KAF1814057.1 hypothetical protein P152DRAFT_303156 [Eremomyces bilateralis CBS 781.70]
MLAVQGTNKATNHHPNHQTWNLQYSSLILNIHTIRNEPPSTTLHPIGHIIIPDHPHPPSSLPAPHPQPSSPHLQPSSKRPPLPGASPRPLTSPGAFAAVGFNKFSKLPPARGNWYIRPTMKWRDELNVYPRKRREQVALLHRWWMEAV